MNDVLIMGVGGTGCSIAGHVQSMIDCRVVAVNTNKKSLDLSSIKERLLIGPRECSGYSAHVPTRGKRAAEESREELKSLLCDSRLLVLIAGLGGGTATGAAPVIVKLAQEQGMNVLVMVTLPFSVESTRRDAALAGLKELRSMDIPVLVHDNAESEVTSSSLLDVLEEAKKVIADNIANLNEIEIVNNISSSHYK